MKQLSIQRNKEYILTKSNNNTHTQKTQKYNKTKTKKTKNPTTNKLRARTLNNMCHFARFISMRASRIKSIINFNFRWSIVSLSSFRSSVLLMLTAVNPTALPLKQLTTVNT